MNRKSIVIIAIALHVIFNQGDEVIENMKENVRMDMLTKDFCEVSEFEDLDYYLFCDTMIQKYESDFVNKPIIINRETVNIDDAKELYQKFEEKLFLNLFEEGKMYIEYISPDCQWVIATRWSGHRDYDSTTKTQKLFYEKREMKEKTLQEDLWEAAFIVVKKGEHYEELEKQDYQKTIELKNQLYKEEGYYNICSNEEGTLLTGVGDDERLAIKNIKDGSVLWSCSLQGIQDEVQRIREEGQEQDWYLVEIVQFNGDEKGGRIIVQVGLSSFFEIEYPSGKSTYLGEYLYSACYSPDRKYIAYSSENYISRVDMEQDELEKIAPGIYIREVETGKTAYIYWDLYENSDGNYMETRTFMWIEKDSFDKYMG